MARIVYRIVWGKALAAALIFAKQLASTKLEFGDLRKANYRIGRRAYEGGILLSGHEDLTSQLVDLQISITALKDRAHGSASTLAEKAKVALRMVTREAKETSTKRNPSKKGVAPSSVIAASRKGSMSLLILSEFRSSRS